MFRIQTEFTPMLQKIAQRQVDKDCLHVNLISEIQGHGKSYLQIYADLLVANWY